jgi:hypothetical protein
MLIFREVYNSYSKTQHSLFSKVVIQFFLILLIILLSANMSTFPLPAPLESTLNFTSIASRVSEGALTTGLSVNLSAAPGQAVTVGYRVVGGSASGTTLSSGKDFVLDQGTLTFEPNSTTQTMTISLIDDSINEVDETLQIQLFNPSNAVLGANSTHTLTIADNDRKSLVSVKDFGAKGDGVTDDTVAIRSAIDAVVNWGGGVVVFPDGTYSVTSVQLKDNITYHGYGATILRPDRQDKWTRTFTTNYSGNTDSKPLIVQGLTFDGNSSQQGSYQNYELEQAHLLFLMGDPNLPGKLQAIVEDCTFKNGVADAISVYTNVDVKVYHCEAIDVFRGGFVLTGGNSFAEVYHLKTQGQTDPTGIDIEVDGRGYGNTLRVSVKLENLNLVNGDFDIGVEEGSTVVGNNIVADAPFSLFNLNSTMQFTNSTFKVGATDNFENRIILPGQLTFENCEFYATRQETGKPYRFFSAIDVWWQHPEYPVQRDQILTLNNCSFKLDSSIQSTDLTYAIYSREDSPSNNNQLIVNGGSISPDFDAGIVYESAQKASQFNCFVKPLVQKMLYSSGI